jgi:hypothetical protein
MRNSSLFRLFAILAILLLNVLGQESGKLERRVSGQTVTSAANPAVKIEVAKPFIYVGGQVIDIFKVAGAEQHFFVDAAPDKSVKRFYWIQFEQYYPENNYTSDYGGIPQVPVKLGRLDFAADTEVVKDYFTSDNRAGSDSEAGLKLLQTNGYNVNGDFVRTRMFHLPSADKRKELMIIYGEVVAPGTSEDAAKTAAQKHAVENITLK